MRLLSAPVVEVASGVDALYLSGRADMSPDFFEYLRSLKAGAAASGERQSLALGDTEFWVAAHGWGLWPILLEHKRGRVGLGDSVFLPTVRVQPFSAFLHGVGAAAVTPWFDDQLSQALGPIQWSASRVDLFVDVVGWSLGAEDRERFVCRSKSRITHEVGSDLTGFEFGSRKAPIFGRLYDKTVEVEKKGKTWWHNIWGDRWSGEQVWRFEAQIQRQGLRQFGIESPEDALGMRGGAWGHITDRWLTYRTPSSDGNRSRWPVAPEWEAIQRASLRAGAEGLDRITNAQRAASLSRLVPAARGYLASAGALLGATTYEETVRRLQIPIAQVGARSGVSFEALLARRAAEFGLAQ